MLEPDARAILIDQLRPPVGGSAAAAAGVFESVVNALAHNPESLDALDSLVERLMATESGRRVIPDGFPELWATISAARRRMEPR